MLRVLDHENTIGGFKMILLVVHLLKVCRVPHEVGARSRLKFHFASDMICKNSKLKVGHREGKMSRGKCETVHVLVVFFKGDEN